MEIPRPEPSNPGRPKNLHHGPWGKRQELLVEVDDGDLQRIPRPGLGGPTTLGMDRSLCPKPTFGTLLEYGGRL